MGDIPSYNCFEPKRTSPSEYEEMKALFSNNWNYLEVSKSYIKNDCIALYQVLLRFTINDKFPMNPLNSLSAPSASFRIWRAVQLPKIGHSVMDFSNSEWDAYLRQSYCGGIVDVYRPHLKTTGYYYDVNSLYPTAMCKPMPVGIPEILDSLTTEQFLEDNFFGFLEATVQAPENTTPGGYIGLLPIKLNGRLV
jgi:hypothetical protein